MFHWIHEYFYLKKKKLKQPVQSFCSSDSHMTHHDPPHHYSHQATKQKIEIDCFNPPQLQWTELSTCLYLSLSFFRSICIPPSWPASPRVCALSDCLALSAWWLHLSARSSVRWNKNVMWSFLSGNDAPFHPSYCFLQYCGPDELHVLLCWVNHCLNLLINRINYGWFYIQTQIIL